MLPSATVTAANRALPSRTCPDRNLPHLLSKESSRESLRPPCCRLQLLPRITLPCPAARRPDWPDQIYSPKRAAERTDVLSAAVCNCYLTRTCRTFPDRTTPHQAGTRPSLPSRNLPRLLFKRAAGRTVVLRAAVCSYCRTLSRRIAPRLARPELAEPSWGLHQRMPSMIRLLFQRASGSDFR